MKKICIFSLLISLFLLAQFCSAGSDDSQDTTSVKTGDIEVTAKGVTLPPYKVGLELTLNRMPKMQAVEIPNWIDPRPERGKASLDWHNKIKDSLGEDAGPILDYIYDSLGIRSGGPSWSEAERWVSLPCILLLL